MATQKKSRTRKGIGRQRTFSFVGSFNFFIALAVLLGMLAGVMLVKVAYKGEPIRNHIPKAQVELGSYRYEFTGDKAIKRSDKLTTSLQVFLDKKAASDCAGLAPSRYNVISSSSDRTQVLLGYGCNGNTDARMYAVYVNSAWKLLSPTNQFDLVTNTPRCEYVTANAIDKSLAPVCFNKTATIKTYIVR